MTKDYYSEQYWGKSPPRADLEEREKKSLSLLLKKTASRRQTFLDLGCGDGCFLFSTALLDPKLELFGIDASETQLKKAQKRLPQGRFSHGNFESQLPYESNSFDLIFSGEILEHIVDTDHFISEAHRVLAPGGMLCITTPNLLAWYNRVFIACGMSPLFVEYSTKDASVGYGILRARKEKTPVGHLRIFHPRAVVDLLSKCGFRICSVHAAEFTALPRWMRVIDRIISRCLPNAGSISIVCAEKLKS